MDTVSVRESAWRGVDAWTITAPALELVVTKVGAHIASICEPGDRLNPLWQPHWPATNPQRAASRPDVYGNGPETELLAGIVGHNMCIDRFGAPYPGETRPVHGEAGCREWSLAGSAGDPDGTSVVLTIHLDEAELDLIREFNVSGTAVQVSTTVRHGADEARQIEWAEHVTIGDPFLDGAEFETSAVGAWISGGEPSDHWRFPGAEPESPVNVRAALGMPRANDPVPAGDIIAMRLARGWFRAVRRDLGRFVEYEWDADEFPWLCVWTQHHSRTMLPWNGVERARGMEFSTKPFPEGKPPASRATEFHGSPTTCSVPPGEGLTRVFVVRWARL